MRFRSLFTAICCAAILGFAAPQRTSLFDGHSLDGWQGDANFWHVVDGAITAGEAGKMFPHNDFLVTTRSFQNFDLHAKLKLIGTEGFVNSGIQFRSIRVPNNFEMSGYQADAGDGYWGSLYDETRRDMTLAKPIDPAGMAGAFHNQDWNDYHVRAEGPHIELWLNGVKTVDYMEKDAAIPQDGFIGLQIHGNGKTVVEFKDVSIEELPPTPGAPTWAKIGGYHPRHK